MYKFDIILYIIKVATLRKKLSNIFNVSLIKNFVKNIL